VLHVARDAYDMPVDPFVLKYIEGIQGRMILRESDYPLFEINKYIDDNEVGILVMIHRERGFIKNLMLKGFTTEELGLVNVPLLVLPEVNMGNK